MAEDRNQRILSQYDKRIDLYRDLASTVEGLIKRMLRELDIPVHSVTCRVKDRESLEKKIAQPDKNYAELSDLTDIAGIRIITYFEDDVDKIAERLEAEFSIDWANTTDKRAALDPDRFGYLTMQHVAEFDANRTKHFEYADFKGLKFEIQTRSILQHAWAEMEHDLGYKTPESIPREARRRFSRLAGMLEIADDEFRRLRDDLERYRRDVPQRIEKDPQEVEINQDSLFVFSTSNSLVQALDEEIASIASTPLLGDGENVFVTGYTADTDIRELKLLGLETIQDLESSVYEHREDLIAFVMAYWQLLGEDTESGHFEPGVSLFYLAYFLAAKTLGRDRIGSYLNAAGVQSRGADPEKLGNRIMEAYELASGMGS